MKWFIIIGGLNSFYNFVIGRDVLLPAPYCTICHVEVVTVLRLFRPSCHLEFFQAHVDLTHYLLTDVLRLVHEQFVAKGRPGGGFVYAALAVIRARVY